MGCMRTNIVLDDELIAEARKYSKARSRRALVEEALRTFVEVRATEERTKTYRARLLALEDRLQSLRLRERPRDLVRSDRDRR
jgi:Arc/MetJ family transcription regulator